MQTSINFNKYTNLLLKKRFIKEIVKIINLKLMLIIFE